MESIWNEITAAVNDHLCKKSQGRLTSLLLFDDVGFDYVYKYSNEPVLLNKSNFLPRGSTPLRDAILHGVQSLTEDWGDFLWQEFVEVEFTIFTDGRENSSYRWEIEDVARAINHFQNNYNWKFSFIGAGERTEVAKYAAQFGIKSENCIGYTKKEELSTAFAAV